MYQQDDVVAVLAQALCQRIGEPRYKLWFSGKTKLTCDGDQLAVGVPNLFLQDWLHKTFEADIRTAAAEAFGHAVAVRFVIDPELFQAARREANHTWRLRPNVLPAILIGPGDAQHKRIVLGNAHDADPIQEHPRRIGPLALSVDRVRAAGDDKRWYGAIIVLH